MELLDYLDPVELDKPEEFLLQGENIFSKKIDIHTVNFEFDDLSKYDVALLGVPEDRNSNNKGASLASNAVRGELYKLTSPVSKSKIIDLGNLKLGNTYTDTYFALKEVVNYLLCNNIITVIIGGTQELTHSIFQAFENYQDKINLCVFDSRIDAYKEALRSTSESYLFELLLKKSKIFRFVHAGHQTYLTDVNSLDFVSKLFHEVIRLGEIRKNIQMIEPFLRDSDFVSIDISCVRQSDSPGNYRPSPNGFYAEEACQITRYAGTGDLVKVLGVFEVNPKFDINNHSSAVAAQMIWYFLEGVESRNVEIPAEEDNNFKTFIVGHNDLDYDMTFYKSMNTERWWLEVPNTNSVEQVIISCSHEDYKTACNHEVPNIWWRNFQKLN